MKPMCCACQKNHFLPLCLCLIVCNPQTLSNLLSFIVRGDPHIQQNEIMLSFFGLAQFRVQAEAYMLKAQEKQALPVHRLDCLISACIIACLLFCVFIAPDRKVGAGGVGKKCSLWGWSQLIDSQKPLSRWRGLLPHLSFISIKQDCCLWCRQYASKGITTGECALSGSPEAIGLYTYSCTHEGPSLQMFTL